MSCSSLGRVTNKRLDSSNMGNVSSSGVGKHGGGDGGDDDLDDFCVAGVFRRLRLSPSLLRFLWSSVIMIGAEVPVATKWP